MPPLLILSIEWEQLHDELVNLRERQHLTLGVLNGHGDQGYETREEGERYFSETVRHFAMFHHSHSDRQNQHGGVRM